MGPLICPAAKTCYRWTDRLKEIGAINFSEVGGIKQMEQLEAKKT